MGNAEKSLTGHVRLIFGEFVDFLFPKDLEVLKLETLSPATLLKMLPNAADLGEDTLAIFSYTDSSVRDLVWELKYRKNMKIAESLAVIVYDVLRHELAERALFESASWRICPLLIPMPMSAKRRAERGWNQTETLCEEIKKLDTENLFEYKSDILRKIAHTDSQTLTENKKQRLRNLENTMSVSGNIQNRCVILLDDVTTTGATFAEARRALRLAGARRILCIALAH